MLLCEHQTFLLDYLMNFHRPQCVVDLGTRGVGHGSVHGRYLKYLFDKHQLKKGIGIDVESSEEIERMKVVYPFEMVRGDFNEVIVTSPFDCVLFFRVLLHQLNWKESLRNWRDARTVVLYDYKAEKTRRLTEDPDWYEENVLKYMENTGANTQAGREIIRSGKGMETVSLWQWSISEDDITNHMRSMKYNKVASIEFGRHKIPWLKCVGYVFER